MEKKKPDVIINLNIQLIIVAFKTTKLYFRIVTMVIDSIIVLFMCIVHNYLIRWDHFLTFKKNNNNKGILH